MGTCLTSIAILAAAITATRPSEAPPTPFENDADLSSRSKIDELAFYKMRQANVKPARICSDGVFIRRAYLDVIGTLPTADDVRQFLADRNPNKRRILIDRLLDRPEFADYWAMKWSDLLRLKAEFPINLWPNAAQAYHRWIVTALRQNRPYDHFVRELLTSSGSNFREPPVNFYRAIQSRQPQAIAQAVALTLMGVRAEKWPKEQLADLSVFFSYVGYKATMEWKEEIVYFDPDKRAQNSAESSPGSSAANGSLPITAKFPDGATAALSPEADPRQVFADWLISPKNPWFARNIVNRIWYWLLGRGIIHEPDDIRADNPPQNPQLLAYLERELITSHYDLKHVYRLILQSKVYQLSSVPRSNSPKAEACFASYPLRRLEAEVLADALCQITGTTEQYSSAIPEPFTYVPEDLRSIELEDGSISSSFLELFGRPPRDTGLESERNNRPTDAQALHLLNSSHVQRKIEQSSKLMELVRSSRNPRDSIETLYLTILSRLPTDDELKIITTYSTANGVRGREMLVDLAWALVNSAEFLYRH